MAQREELKLIYRESKLEKIELAGRRIAGLSTFIKGVQCPSVEELRVVYDLKFEYKN